MPASDDRRTRTTDGHRIERPVLAATRIFAGTMVARDNAGWCKPAGAVATQKTIGVAEEQADNAGGANGDIRVKIRRKVTACFANSAAADLIGSADVGNDCYVVDDQTVAKTDNSSAGPVAGRIVAVDAAGVWVEFG